MRGTTGSNAASSFAIWTYYRDVIDTGSMEGGGSAWRISACVSKSIADLERALGVRLVDRSRRGVVPTPYGLALKSCSVAIFNDLRQGVADIDFLSDPTQGEIRIGATDPVMTAISPPRLIVCPASIRRWLFTSSSATRRCSIERSQTETLNGERLRIQATGPRGSRNLVESAGAGPRDGRPQAEVEVHCKWHSQGSRSAEGLLD